MHPEWELWLERGRVLLSAPPLRRNQKASNGPHDPKWGLGDLLLEMPDELVDTFVEQLGQERGIFRTYRQVAQAWPSDRRAAASWATHRELKDHADRFALITDGMSVRDAGRAAGKQPVDAKPDRRLTVEERIERAKALLTDPDVSEALRQQLQQSRAARRERRLANLVRDEHSAARKEADKELRDAERAQHPELAFIRVLTELRRFTQYVLALIDAAGSTEDGLPPLIPSSRQPDLVVALEDLADAVSDAFDTLSSPRPEDQPTGDRVVIDVEATESRRMVELLESTS